jgi:hypothetical protein
LASLVFSPKTGAQIGDPCSEAGRRSHDMTNLIPDEDPVEYDEDENLAVLPDEEDDLDVLPDDERPIDDIDFESDDDIVPEDL